MIASGSRRASARAGLSRKDRAMTHHATNARPAAAPVLASHTLPTTSSRLDLAGLRSAVVLRRACLARLETAMVAACEHAAARGRADDVQMDDRATWDRATWQRYLDAAARLEPEYGPAMRRLLQEIDQLNRLMALPLAA
jgi:hypothetical protein